MIPTGALENTTFAFLWLLVFTMPWENILVVPGVGTVGRLIGISAGALAALALAAEVRPRIPNRLLALTAAYVVWSALSFFWSIDGALTVDRLVTNVQLLLMLLLIWQFAQHRRRQLALMRAYVAGSCVSAAFTVSNYLAGRTSVYDRYAASGFDPNDLGLLLALAVIMSWSLAMAEHRSAPVWAYRAQMVLAVSAIFLTASRGAMLALLSAVPLIVFTLARLRPAQAIAAALAATAALVSVLYLVPAASWQRLSTIGAEISGGSLNERRRIWEAGLDVWREHPVLGVGAGAFPLAVERGLGYPQAAHNLYLSVLTEGGAVGFLLFLIPVAALALAVARSPLAESLVLGTLLLAWAIGVFSLAWEWRKPTFFLIGLVAAWVAAPPDPRAAKL